MVDAISQSLGALSVFETFERLRPLLVRPQRRRPHTGTHTRTRAYTHTCVGGDAGERRDSRTPKREARK
jgi:hypothetical protein